jgi:DNA-binding NtrC family response regulator
VRELENAISRCVVNGELDAAIGTAPLRAAGSLHEAVRDFERAHIARALRESGGNRTRTACRLGVSRQALVAKLTRWGLAAAQ